jgi:hypothetical protein
MADRRTTGPTAADPSKINMPAAWLAVMLAASTILLLASLHVLSPEFDPSWRVVSEYALGRYSWVLSLMFLSWGISSWALAAAIWSQVRTKSGVAGLWFLIIAGLGEAMASAFDIAHPLGHGIAGLLGVIGFPIAALLLSVALGRNENWHAARRPLQQMARTRLASSSTSNGNRTRPTILRIYSSALLARRSVTRITSFWKRPHIFSSMTQRPANYYRRATSAATYLPRQPRSAGCRTTKRSSSPVHWPATRTIRLGQRRIRQSEATC